MSPDKSSSSTPPSAASVVTDAVAKSHVTSVGADSASPPDDDGLDDAWDYRPRRTPFSVPLDEEFLFIYPISLLVLALLFVALIALGS